MPPHRSILWYLSLTLAVLYLLGTVFGGIGLGEIALHPASPPISQSEERNAEASAQQNSVEFRDVELVTQDGVSLRAWFMRPREANGNTVILLHGVSDNRENRSLSWVETKFAPAKALREMDDRILHRQPRGKSQRATQR